MSFRLPFFKSRAAQQPPAAQPTVDQLRQRARQRLIGSSLLVLVGVVGFPFVFDTQPRAVPVNIPIEIPDKASVPPLLPASGRPAAPLAAASAALAQEPLPQANSLTDKEEIVPTRPTERAAAAAKAALPAEPVAVAKPPARPPSVAASVSTTAPSASVPAPTPVATASTLKPPADGQRAKALLEGQVPTTAAEAAPNAARYVVQVGAFADAAKLRELRAKLEHAGLKTYVQEVQTKDGSRSRVRMGPFATRAEADRVLAKLKALDLHATVLTL